MALSIGTVLRQARDVRELSGVDAARAAASRRPTSASSRATRSSAPRRTSSTS